MITDSFTKFSVAVPCKDQTAASVATALRDKWFACYGIPSQIHTDQGRSFEGSLVHVLCKLYNIKKTHTTPYHAQENGQTERFNKTLCGLIKSLDQKNRRDWPQLLPHLVFIYNTTPHSVTGFTPFTLMFGRQPTVPLDHLLNNARRHWDNNVVVQQAELIQQAYKVAKGRMEKAANANKRRYDQRAHASVLPVGSPVLLKNCGFTERHKLQDHFGSDRYIVIKTNSEKDLYAIVPLAGGPEKWVNRKMLIPDPRGVLHKPIDPLQGLPRADDEQHSARDDSDSESEGELIPVMPPSPSKPDDNPLKSGTQRSEPHTRSSQSKPGQVLRRSERLRRKRSSSWPKDVT